MATTTTSDALLHHHRAADPPDWTAITSLAPSLNPHCGRQSRLACTFSRTTVRTRWEGPALSVCVFFLGRSVWRPHNDRADPRHGVSRAFRTGLTQLPLTKLWPIVALNMCCIITGCGSHVRCKLVAASWNLITAYRLEPRTERQWSCCALRCTAINSKDPE